MKVKKIKTHSNIISKISLKLEKLLDKVEFDIKRNHNLSRPFSSKKELKKHLDLYS